MNHKEMESVLSKCMRQASDEEREEEDGRRKKRASTTSIQMVEADEQLRQ